MAGKFRFCGLAEITHINARKEGPDDDKELAVDVKFSAAKVPAWILDLLGDDLVGLLFIPGSQAVRNPMLGPLTFAHEIEDYRLEILGGIHHGCRVKKITATPADGEVVTLTFGVSFKPSGDEVARMAEYLQDAVAVDLGPASAELELNDQRAAA